METVLPVDKELGELVLEKASLLRQGQLEDSQLKEVLGLGQAGKVLKFLQ